MKSVCLLQKIQKFSKWLLTTTSVFTMAMWPVTQGQAAQNDQTLISKAQVQSAIIQLGLNKKTTFGEFYKKNKSMYPERIQVQLEKFIAANADYVMPQFEVTSAKNSSGQEIPSVRISKDGELVNLQVYGDSEKYVKLNNTILSEVDIVNFKDMFLRLYNHDAIFRKQVETTQKTSQKTSFNGYPAVSKATWKAMTPQQRAGYLINMRLLWNDSRSVLFEIQKNKQTKKTSSNDYYEQFFKLLLANAEAAAKNRAKKASLSDENSAVAESEAGFSQGKACLIAGYVTEYSGSVCDHKKIKGSYRGSELYSAAAAYCTGGEIACNPLVFGTPNGKAKCIKPGTNADFQIATHYEGPCERDNHLGSKVQFLKDPAKRQGRYDTDNLAMDDAKIKEQLKKDQGENLEATKSFIDGILKFGNKDLSDSFIKGEMNDTLIQKLKEIRDDFNEEIRQAKTACIAASNANQKQENNFWDACDQLQRRQIFVSEYLSKNPGCKDAGILNTDSLKCQCQDANKTEVNLGAMCPAVKDDKKPDEKTQTVVSEKPEKPEKQKTDEKCNGVIETGPTGAEVCIPATEGKESKKSTATKKEDNWMTGLFSKVLPWIVGGVALFLMYKLWAPKKPELKQAADGCPNGGAPPSCIATCAYPLANVNGACVCASCAPGQNLNASTCTCSLGSTTTTPTDITCPDNMTHAATFELCPQTASFTCWNGAVVANAINCPTQPVSAPSTKTGR